ncbi:hypothetical protein DFH08DRAFT_1018388 [Mycena albidolilacea]|uniref:Uncharacterized protein n=1 Tax=Mycena albidolilacea TaxID=1033008 RepID=A0AAD6ZSN8_9AGAR|nr:hypothetical protein DFH08DRAFT_1018388 [Mycena albidolilacea]
MLGYGSEIQKPHATFDQWNYRSSSPAHASTLMLPSSQRTSSPFHQNAEFRVHKLEKENSLLCVENEAIKLAYHELVTAVPALIAATSNPFGLPVAAASGAGSGPSPFGQLKTPRPLLKSDYPFVNFWNRNDFMGLTKSDGVSNTGGPNPRGGALASQGVNVSGKYIEDANGEVVDGYRVTAIGKFAQGLWFWLLEHGRAPPTWGRASIDVVQLYCDEMGRQFPELRLCTDNWKAKQIATNNYPSWIKNHSKVKIEEAVEVKSTTVKQEAQVKPQKRALSALSTSPPDIEQSKKIKLDDKDLLSFNPLAEPNSAPPDTPAAEPAPSAVTTATSLEISSDVSHTAAVFPATATQEPVAPAPTKAEVQAALIQTAFPPAVPSPTSEGPAPPAPSQSTAVTRGRALPGKMTATNSLTPRNLCARDWIPKNRHGTRAQFGQYWDGLANTPEEEYWNTVSASAKANAATNAALALA